MTKGSYLSEMQITIIGLGLMGGSIAMALKGKCKMIFGVDANPETIQYAIQNDIVDQASTHLESIPYQTDLIILAAPVQTILHLIQALPLHIENDTILMDIGSTKREIVAAMEQLPERFDPIGCHPMCGKENLTIRNADPEMFTGSTFAITPLERTSQKTINLAHEIATTIGSIPLVIDPETHDLWTGATSHLPYLLSLALSLSTPTEVFPLVGPGFKSTVRLAGTPKSMMVDILRTNRDEVLHHLNNYIAKLNEIAGLIDSSAFEKLSVLMEAGKEKKEFFTNGGQLE